MSWTVRPKGLLLAAALASGLLCVRADTPVPVGAEQTVMVFLGFEAAEQDASYRSFRASWLQRASGRCRGVEPRYVQALEHSDAGRAAAASAAAALHPALVVAPSAGLAQAARQATSAPLVFASYLNPVHEGIVSSELARAEPVTGVALDDRLLVKRIDILHEAFPAARTIGLLVDQAWRQDSGMDAVLAGAHQRLGLRFVVVAAESPEELPAAFEAAAVQHVQAWVIPPTQIGYEAEAEIIGRLRRGRVPAIHATTGEVQQGALMAYAQDTSFAYDALAALSNRVCNGEPAGSIPIERPRRFMLSIRSDYDLGDLRLAPAVVARADHVE